MNWFEEALASVAPGLAVKRAQARMALVFVRAYEGAKVGRRTENWRAAGTSANAEIAPSLSTLRNRSRQLVRDNPYASRALAAFAAKAVGTGIRARPDPNARKAWDRFVMTCDLEGDCDLYGLQLQAAMAAFESGEVLIRRIRTKDINVPLQLQLLEADYIDSAKYGDYNGNFIIAGVEIDRLGRRQAIWLFDQHPGEVKPFGNYISKRVPANELIHFYEKGRPGQLRGVPRFASSLMRARDLDEYRDALLVKKKIEACFAAFVVGGNPSIPLGEGKVSAETGKRTETLSPGMIEYIPNGQDVKFASPSSGGNESEFTTDELHAIAAGAGVTYEQMTGDLRRVSFGSMRQGEINIRELVDVWRWIQFVPRFCVRITQWFEDAYWTAGQLRTTGYDYIWTAPKWVWIDPLKDIKADKEEVLAGFASKASKIRERGEDPAEVHKEIKEERDEDSKDGLVFDTDAGHKIAATVAAANDAGDEDGADGEDDGDGEAKTKKDDADRSATHLLSEAVVTLSRAVERAPAPAITNNINVPERGIVVNNRAGDVNVPAPAITVNAGDVLVDATTKTGPTRTTVEKRDKNGELEQFRTDPIEGGPK